MIDEIKTKIAEIIEKSDKVENVHLFLGITKSEYKRYMATRRVYHHEKIKSLLPLGEIDLGNGLVSLPNIPNGVEMIELPNIYYTQELKPRIIEYMKKFMDIDEVKMNSSFLKGFENVSILSNSRYVFKANLFNLEDLNHLPKDNIQLIQNGRLVDFIFTIQTPFGIIEIKINSKNENSVRISSDFNHDEFINQFLLILNL